MQFSIKTTGTSKIVLDSSVIINLAGSGYGARIVSSVPFDFFATSVVQDELIRGLANERKHAETLQHLVDAALIKIEELPEEAEKIFEELVFGKSCETLDDGEASTLALASVLKANVAIDDKKAIKISQEKFQNISLVSSCDIFSHPSVLDALTQLELRTAIVNALQETRMRVPEHMLAWVVKTIGEEQVIKCRSLPRALRNACTKSARQ